MQAPSLELWAGYTHPSNGTKWVRIAATWTPQLRCHTTRHRAGRAGQPLRVQQQTASTAIQSSSLGRMHAPHKMKILLAVVSTAVVVNGATTPKALARLVGDAFFKESSPPLPLGGKDHSNPMLGKTPPHTYTYTFTLSCARVHHTNL